MSDFVFVHKDEPAKKVDAAVVEKERFTRDERYQLAGWALFVVSSALYTLAGVQFKSGVTVIASLFFLVACLVFMYPILHKPHR